MHRTIQRSTHTALIAGALLCGCADDDVNADLSGSQSGDSANAGRTAGDPFAGAYGVADAPASGSTTDQGDASVGNGIADAPASGSTTDRGGSNASGPPGGPVFGENGNQTSGGPGQATGPTGQSSGSGGD